MSGTVIRQSTMDIPELNRIGNSSGNLRNLGNGHGRESALQLFVQSKRRINDIFKDIGDYVKEVDKFVKGELIWSLFSVS